MNSSSPLERIVQDVQGLVVELKKEYFTRKIPLDDDEILVHRLCVKLENVLRCGAREKYTLFGVRKDYWNFFNESLPKDETVRFIQSINEIKTNRGKGRAFLRHALMEKSLADTFQRSVINTRLTKDYYGTESVMRSEVYFQPLLHSLYDLNAVDFLLPHQGYDLDKNFPSFARKSFTSRRNSSTGSVCSVQSTQPDPVDVLRTNVGLLELVVNAWLGKVADGGDDETSEQEQQSLLQTAEKVKQLREHLITLKTMTASQMDDLKGEIENLKEEKLKQEAYMGQRLSLAHDHYRSIHSVESTAAEEKVKNISEKLATTEQMLADVRSQHSADFLDLTTSLSEAQGKCDFLQSENEGLAEMNRKYEDENHGLRDSNQSHLSKNKILENKLSDLQKINSSLLCNEKEQKERNQQLELDLKLKETELCVLRDTQDKSTGLVVGSVEEIKLQLSSHQERTTEVLSATNESKYILSNTVDELTAKVDNLEAKLIQVTSEKEELEKVVIDLKSKLAEDTKSLGDFEIFFADLWASLEEDTVDHIKSGDSGSKDAALKKIADLKNNSHWKQRKEIADEEILNLKEEIKELTQALDVSQAEASGDKDGSQNDEEDQIAKLKNEVEQLNGRIYDMSVEIITLNDASTRKQADLKRVEDSSDQLQKDMDQVKLENVALSHEKKALEDELSRKSEELVCVATKETSLAEELSEKHNVYSVTLQEVQSLKFQLSTEEMKLDGLTKELCDTRMEKDNIMNELSILTKSYEELKGSKCRDNDNWVKEKETLTAERDSMTQQCGDITNRYSIAEKEITFLKVELSKLAKEKEEEKESRSELSNEIEDWKKREKEKLVVIEQHSQDFAEIKSQLVNCIREKDELWQKKEQLELELSNYRERPAERWITDTEVDRCTSCKELFSITRRKHHCRLCGKIFCNDCSNKWVKSHQSRKKVRSCFRCAEIREELADKFDGSYDENMTSSTYSDGPRSLVGSDEETSDVEKLVVSESQEETVTELSCEELADTGAFEILGAEEVTKPETSGTNECIEVLGTDLIKSSLIPVCRTDDELEVEKEMVKVDVAAGIRVLLPVVVPGSNVDLSWDFTSTPKDVGFGVAFKPQEETQDLIQTVVPLSRYMSHKLEIHGKMTVPHPGTYYLIFDNSYSRLTMKTVDVSVALARSKKTKDGGD